MTTGYDFEKFESTSPRARAGEAAPQRKQPKQEPLKKVEKKNSQQKKRESRKAAYNSAFILFFAAVMLGVLCLQISAGAKRYELSRQIASIEAKIEIAKSENVRLSSELNSITSIGKIDDYATKILGMSKIESYQVEYIELSDGDRVIYSSDRGLLNIFN